MSSGMKRIEDGKGGRGTEAYVSRYTCAEGRQTGRRNLMV